MKNLLGAVKFAAEKHSDQRRKNADATPYINHPVEVTELLAGLGKVRDEEILKAALLHDTIEDTDTTYEEIRKNFGERVADMVVECTDDKTLPKGERKRLQIVKAPAKSPGAKQVKLSDKICNVKSIVKDPPRDWPLERRVKYCEWAREVVQGLRGVNPKLEKEFDRVYHEVLNQIRREEDKNEN